MLPSSVIGGKTPLEVWWGKIAYDYDSLRIFGCSAYYHIKEDKLGPRTRTCVFIGFKKGMKDYKIWDPRDKKIILSRAATFDEASMVKPMDSQQVKSKKTNKISQQVESEATPPSPDSSVSFEITPEVTQGDDHVADEDANDEKGQGHVMGDVQNSLQLKEPKKFT